MSKFHNPYHFIPLQPMPDGTPPGPGCVSLADFDAGAPTVDHARHDRWSPDGLSGRITCRLKTVTPVVVGGTRDDRPSGVPRVQPFRAPEGGDPAIPASTLRGLVSNLAEAASHSALRVSEDRHFSYRKTMKKGLSAMGMVIAVRDGLHVLPLTEPVMPDYGDGWELDPRYAAMFPKEAPRVSFGTTARIRQQAGEDGRSSFLSEFSSWDIDRPAFYALRKPLTRHEKPPGKNSPAYLLGCSTREEPVPWDANKHTTSTHVCGILRILGVSTDGRINAMPTKKHEFFLPVEPTFLEDLAAGRLTTWPVLPEAIERFEALADERAADNRDGTKPLDRLPYTLHGHEHVKVTRPDGERLPTLRLRHGDIVFFLPTEDGTAVEEVSFTSIWRHRTEHRVPGQSAPVATHLSDFLAKLSPDLLPAGDPRKTRLTMAELLFGFAEEHGTRALAGRVFPTDALPLPVQGELLSDEWVDLQVLNSPKPPSPALYFTPDGGRPGWIAKSDLALGSRGQQRPAARPLGRKAYLHAQNAAAKKRPNDPTWTMHPRNRQDLAAMRLQVRPILAEREFEFHFDFENLTPLELGLLCYALRPSDGFRHKLGMGRPLGLGTVEITPVSLRYIDRFRRYRADALTEPRFHTAWHAPASPPTSDRPCAAEHSFPALRAEFRSAVETFFPTLPAIIETLGDPAAVRHPVHYPQVAGPQPGSAEFEIDRYEWWVANDDKRNRDRQFLHPVQPGQPLPTLERLEKVQRGAGGHGRPPRGNHRRH